MTILTSTKTILQPVKLAILGLGVASITLASSLFQGSAAQEATSVVEIDAFADLTTYAKLKVKLQALSHNTERLLVTGPLILNGRNKGLINIDGALDTSLNVKADVCGADTTSPTIRQAVLCTVNDEFGGNKDAALVGRSNKGREILAARLGNPDGKKVMIITQQHGNEVAGTEAALAFLSNAAGTKANAMLDVLDILVILRANPDGGEPKADCTRILPVASPFKGDCALTRTNLDPAAGGGFLRPSETDFSGVVGHGYNLNRYHYAGLQAPIRPVEAQAMVAAALAFQPDYVLDLHGDQPKTDCAIDMTSLKQGVVLGKLPSATCEDHDHDMRKISVFAETLEDTGFEGRALAAAVLDGTVEAANGSVGRFSQIQLGAGTVNVGTSTAYQKIGAVTGGWETENFTAVTRPDVNALGTQGPNVGPNTFLPNAEKIREQIDLNITALNVALETIASFQKAPPSDEGSFCDYPLASGLFVVTPQEFWGGQGSADVHMVPISPKIGVPMFISGACEGDT